MKKLIILLLFIPFVSFSQNETYSGINTDFDTYINTNGTRAITGAILNARLKKLVNAWNSRMYDSTSPYIQDTSIVLYNGYLYLCNTNIVTGEAFNPTKWDKLNGLWTDEGAYITADTNVNIDAGDYYAIGGVRYLHNSGGNIFNTFVGYNSGNFTTTGSGNTCAGYVTGNALTNGQFNTFVGWRVGNQVTTGSENTVVGYSAGSENITGDGNVFIGFSAGLNETGSDKLYIENSNSSSPLIGGDFSTDDVTINGDIEITDTAFVDELIIEGNNHHIGSWDTTFWVNGTDTLWLTSNGTYWKIESNGDTIQVGSNSLKVAEDGNIVITDSLEVNGLITQNGNGVDIIAENTVDVFSVADLPTPVSGLITLDSNTNYVIKARPLTLSDSLFIKKGSSNKIIGNIIYTGSGTFMSGDSIGVLLLNDFTLITSSTDKLFDLNGDDVNLSAIQLNDFSIASASGNKDDIGCFDNLDFVGFSNGSIFNFNDMELKNIEAGTITDFQFSNSFTETDSSLFKITGDSICNISFNNFRSPTFSDEYVLRIDSTIDNSSIIAITQNVGIVNGEFFDPNGLDYKDITVNSQNNNGAQNSSITAMIDFNGNTAVTTIPLVNAKIIVNSNSVSSTVLERIEVDALGVAKYKGKEDIVLDLQFPITLEPESGTNKNLEIQLLNIHAHDSTVVTFDNTTNIINETATPRVNGDIISFYNTGGTLPAELLADAVYYVVNKSTNSFQVSYTSGGAAIAFTDDGSGTNYYNNANLSPFAGDSNIDSGDAKSITRVSLVEVETNDQVCVTVTNTTDAINIEVTNGGLKITK